MHLAPDRVASSCLVRTDLDYHLIRASMVVILLFFGYQKWWNMKRRF